MEFDENKAVEMMRKAISPESSGLYDDDEILNVVDLIWDWYEDNGYLDIDSDDDEEDIDIKALVAYVGKMLAKDSRSPIRSADIEPLVMAEIAYENSLS